jgi:predicted O-methyltransferase YrrM
MPAVSETSPTAPAPTYVRSFHGSLAETDHMASAAEAIDLIAMFVHFTNPKTVVESGTYRGHFAYAIANILRLHDQGGMVYTADPIDNFTQTYNLPDAELLRPYIQYHQGDFLEMLADVPGPIDLAYVDASSVEDPLLRRKHAMAVWKRLAARGLLFVDDTASKDWEDAKFFRQISSLHLPQHRGLTVLQPWRL